MISSIHVQYTDYSGKPHAAEFSGDDTVMVGRRDGDFSPAINLSWDYHNVSRRHARIYSDYNTWYIEQLSATNQTRVNDTLLVPGVPLELPANAVITLGKEGKSVLKTTYTEDEHMPEGDITHSSSRVVDQPGALVSESRRIEVLARIAKTLSQPDEKTLENLLDSIRQYFTSVESAGIALYHDKEITVPASYPRGRAQISFRMARQALETLQILQWDRAAVVSESQRFTSLNGVTQALYAPIVRGSKKVGVIYLHTAHHFTQGDLALLTTISDMLGANAQFQPESAHLRLPSVFISYSHEDSDFVKKLVDDLRRQRVTVWFDERLRGGKDWEEQLATAIQQSDAFALVMSPDSLQSEFVQWEIEQAQKEGKRIFPLWHRECEVIPKDLDKLQRINLLADYLRGVLELVEELYELSGEEDSLAPEPVVRSVGKREKIRILFLAANPKDSDPLRLSAEIRTIQERIRGGKYRDQFDIIQQAWAARFSDLQQHLLEYQPHIVHFSGHGDRAGQLILEDNGGNSQPVNKKTLKLLFNALKDANNPLNGVQLVVLNACFSAIQAEAIAEEVGCVLGMTRAVSDQAAIEFAGSFYNAVTFGKSVLVSFNLASAAMGLTGEEETPKLLAQGIDANDLIFCEED